MTKEKDIKKEADKYADEHAFRVPYDGSNKFYDDVDYKASREGYLAGAEPREKRIEKLEKENAELKKRLRDIELLCYSDGSDGEVLSEIMKYFTKE